MTEEDISRAGAWASAGHGLIPLFLLWLSGMALRLTVLALPPLLPTVRADLHLSETEIGVLSGSIPMLLFGLAALPGSLLIARFGALPTLVAGLIVTGLASLARGAVPNTLLLYVTSILVVLGVAIMQPALPPLVRIWMPRRIGFATAVYTNGLLVGETLAVGLTLPVIMPAAGGSWRLSIAFWAIPVLATAILVAALAPRTIARAAAVRVRRKWWPDWRDKRLWVLALILGCINSIYFGANTFLPEYLDHVQRPELISGALTALNLSQIPASLLMLAVAGRLAQRRASYSVTGLAVLASLCGIVLMPADWVVVWSAALGFVIASSFILMLALPPLLSAPDDVHRMSAGMFAISYGCAVVIPFAAGQAWDMTRIAVVAFAPMALCALAMVLLPLVIDFDSPAAVSPATRR